MILKTGLIVKNSTFLIIKDERVYNFVPVQKTNTGVILQFNPFRLERETDNAVFFNSTSTLFF